MQLLTLPPRIERDELGEPLYNALLMHHGLTFIASPSGQGKSTQLASIAHEHVLASETSLRIALIGDNDYALGEDGQVLTHHFSSEKQSDEQAIRLALKFDPSMILIDTIRHAQTLRMTLTAAECGALVLSSMHASDVSGLFQYLNRMWSSLPENPLPMESNMERFLDATNVLMAQKLVRTVDDERCALIEYLILTPAVRARLLDASRASGNELFLIVTDLVQREGRSLAQHAAKRFARGEIAASQIPAAV